MENENKNVDEVLDKKKEEKDNLTKKKKKKGKEKEILKKEKISGIIFDPPRRGIDEKALRSVVKNKIEKWF